MSIEVRLAAIEARLAALESARSQPAAQATATGVADDRTLDGPYGNPEVRKDPKRWDGPSYAGRRMSDCPSDYLRALAGLYDWMADKDEESGHVYVNKKGESVPTAPLKRKDAALARGWARRNEGQVSVSEPEQRTLGDDFGDDPAIPF